MPCALRAVHHWSSSLFRMHRISPFLNGKSSGSCVSAPENQYVRRLYLHQKLHRTYVGLEVKLSHHALQFPCQRSPQRRRVQIVQNIKGQQLGQIGKGLVANAIHQTAASVTAADGQLDFVDDVVAHFQILFDAQYKVSGAGAAVAYQKYAAVALRHQQIDSLLSGQLAKIPAGSVVHVKWGTHGGGGQTVNTGEHANTK